jgi:hypothetical protein
MAIDPTHDDPDDFPGGVMDNKYNGVQPLSSLDGNTDQDVKANLRIRQSWQEGEGAPPTSTFVLGKDRPD